MKFDFLNASPANKKVFVFLFSSGLEIRWEVRYVRYGSFITDQTHRRVRLGMVTNSHSWTFPPIALWKAPAPAQEHTHFQGGPLRCGPVTVETHGSPQPVTPTPKTTSDSAFSDRVSHTKVKSEIPISYY